MIRTLSRPKSFRKNKKGGCKDISASNCLDDDRYLLEEVKWTESIDVCQYYCRLVHNCLMFRFDGKKCRLLRKDTNKECSIIGGPPVRLFIFYWY